MVCKLACVLLCAFLTLAGNAPAFAAQEYAEGEVLVVYEDGVIGNVTIQSEVSQSMESMDAEVVDVLQSPFAEDVALVQIPPSMSVDKACEELGRLDGVAFAVPNYYVYPDDAEGLFASLDLNDKYYSEQTYIQNYRFPFAWQLVTTNHSVAVAVIDSGCRLTHQDLVDNVDVEHAWDFSDGRDQPLLTSAESGEVANGGDNGATGHGTGVCGIIAAKANNGLGVAGTSYDATVIPIAVFDRDGLARSYTVCKALAKVEELCESMPELKVINMSVGVTGASAFKSYESLVYPYLSRLESRGVLCVASAGNGNTTEPHAPSGFEGVLGVMSLDEDGGHRYDTNYKVGGFIDPGSTVSALGTRVITSYFAGDDKYVWKAGTSMAAPIVTGVAALMWAANPALSPAEVRNIITSTATPVESQNDYAHKDAASAGAVDAYASVLLAKYPMETRVPVPVAVKGLVYNGTRQEGVLPGDDYTLSGSTATSVGTYYATATLRDGLNNVWEDGTSEPKSIMWRISKAANPIKATAANKTAKYSTLKTTSVTVKRPLTVTGAKGALSYAKVSSGSSSALSVSKSSGKVTVKKGTKKGTYTVKIKVTAAGDANHKSKSVTVTCKVVVK